MTVIRGRETTLIRHRGGTGSVDRRIKAAQVEKPPLYRSPYQEKIRKLSDRDLRKLSDQEIRHLLSEGYLEHQEGHNEGLETEIGVTSVSHERGLDPSEYVSLATETYDIQGDPDQGRPAEARVVYGGVAARMWLGTPGESEISASSVAFNQPIRIDEQDDIQEQSQVACRNAVLKQIHALTGVEHHSQDDLDRIEYKVEWVAEGEALGRLARFCDGYVAGPRIRPQDMTLQDVQAAARRWRQGPGASMGKPEPMPRAEPAPGGILCLHGERGATCPTCSRRRV